MIGYSFTSCVRALQDAVRHFNGGELGDDIFAVIHCSDWDKMVRLAIADGFAHPLIGLDPRTAVPGVPLKLEEGEHYEGCVIIKKTTTVEAA